MVLRSSFTVQTKGDPDIIDITDRINSNIEKLGAHEGIALVHVAGSTASVTTIEYESGVIEDLRNAIAKMAPRDIPYRHDTRWGDGNGYAHVRASLLGPSISLPVNSGKLSLGTWQQVILLDFDNRPRKREIVLQFVGEGRSE